MSQDALEARLRELEKEQAVLLSKVGKQEEEIKNLKGGISRGLWILGGGFLAGAASWIMSGGLLNVGQP